jgi:hypothetical protein
MRPVNRYNRKCIVAVCIYILMRVKRFNAANVNIL